MYIYQSLRTPLHKAAHEGHIDVMKMLLAEGANIEAKDGVSARVCKIIWYQMIRRRHTMLLTLLSYDIFDSIIMILYSRQNGETSLVRAVAGNHVGAVKMLLKAGADIQAKYGGVSKRTWIDKNVIRCVHMCLFFSFFFLFSLFVYCVFVVLLSHVVWLSKKFNYVIISFCADLMISLLSINLFNKLLLDWRWLLMFLLYFSFLWTTAVLLIYG